MVTHPHTHQEAAWHASRLLSTYSRPPLQGLGTAVSHKRGRKPVGTTSKEKKEDIFRAFKYVQMKGLFASAACAVPHPVPVLHHEADPVWEGVHQAQHLQERSPAALLC